MAFNFQAYRNPYVSTIADLLSRGEDAKAKALVDTASAQARAAEARGQAYGGAIDSIGKMVAGIPAQIQANKQQALKDKLTLASLTQTNFENEALAGVANDKALVDRAGSAYGAVEPDFTGPLPEGSPMPTREQTLASLPLGLRQQVQESYAKADASAQALEESKAALRAHDAQTAQLDAVRRDKQREYVSDLANELRQHDGSMGSVQLAYDHAKNAGLDAETIAQIDAMYKQLEAAPTDADRLRIAGTVQLHPNTEARNLAKIKEENDRVNDAARRKQDEANLAATIANTAAVDATRRYQIEQASIAASERTQAKQRQDDVDNMNKLGTKNANIAEDVQKLYAALELRAPLAYRQGPQVDLSGFNNADPASVAALQSVFEKSGIKVGATQPLSEEQFINAKNEIDKSARARYGLPPRQSPLYVLPAKNLGIAPVSGSSPAVNGTALPGGFRERVP